MTSASTHSVTIRSGISGDSGLLRTHECRSRDIKRRLEVIQKKMADLEELGVPCGFCYASIRNSGTLFTMGHPAITQPIEKSRHLILDHLSKWSDKGDELAGTGERRKKVHVLLPPLTRPLGELSLSELRGLIIGIVKDLGLKWSDPRPSFWPEEIPFQYPRTTPDGYQGCWSDGLRQVLQSIYSYFNYDISSTRSTVLSSSSSTRSSLSSPLLPLATLPVFNGLPTTTTGLTPLQRDTEGEGEEEEEEEVDVGTLESVPQVPRPHSQPHPQQIDEEEEVMSDGEEEEVELERPLTHAVSYFGYELARSESSHASSPLASSAHDNEDVGRETTLPLLPIATDTKGLSLVQPHLLYCAPGGLYSQLYPALHLSGATPLLLPPSLLMKQLYSSPTHATSNQSPPPDSAHAESRNEHAFLQMHSSANSSLSPSQVSPSQLSPSTNKKMAAARRENEPPPPPPPPPPETKNRKSKNGIYIYTNPTAPLRFMSLSSRKRSASGKSPRSSAPSVVTPTRAPNRPLATPTHILTTPTHEMTAGKKLIAGAPVSPHTGEPVIVRTLGGEGKGGRGQHSVVMHQTLPPSESDTDNGIASKVSSGTPPTSRTNKPQGGGASGRKKRELVFHWYKSPEAPPVSKAPKLLDSAV